MDAGQQAKALETLSAKPGAKHNDDGITDLQGERTITQRGQTLENNVLLQQPK